MNFRWNYAISNGQVQVQKGGLQYLKNQPYLTGVQWDISDLPFVKKITIIKIKQII